MKKIKLTRGVSTVVDNEDFEPLNKYKWFLGTLGYACRTVRRKGIKSTTIYMHREILKTPDGYLSDHIDGDKLNNRKSNLRVCTSQQNHFNQKKTRGVSKYKGVHWNKRDARWIAKLKYNGKTISAGSFKSEEQAALAYNRKAASYFKKFARVNSVSGGGG